MDWFRMYNEFASDPKVQIMPEAMQRRLVMLLCLRCSNTLVTLQDNEIAFALRISLDELAATKALFLQQRFIDDDWNIAQWDKRQFVSDSSAPRVARHRARKAAAAAAAAQNAAVTPGNVTVTPQNRTEAETEAEAEAEDGALPRAPAAPAYSAVDLAKAMMAANVRAQPGHPSFIALAAQGITPDTVTAACAEARKSKPKATDKISQGFVLSIIERWAGEAQQRHFAGALPQARASPPHGMAREESRKTAAASIGLGGDSGRGQSIIDIECRTVAD